ncbi:hypothetical protein [Sphingobacterium faecium]|uniref:hypothetical protein n=1 Tax=Sphingobacterium faecium TaxID=34087 RepID=UPI00320A4AAE
MKNIKIPIESYQNNDFFAPIRTKSDYVKVLLNTVKSILLHTEFSKKLKIKSDEYLFITIDKMKRVFFISDHKIYSIGFPFCIVFNENDEITVTTSIGEELNHKKISEIFSILNDEYYTTNPSLIDFYIGNNIDFTVISILEQLIQTEPSYVRFDHDNSERTDQTYHPQNHLDINYSGYSSYKLGLNKKIDHDFFQNLLDNNFETIYLSHK